jgi:inward rectifier potassium channel
MSPRAMGALRLNGHFVSTAKTRMTEQRNPSKKKHRSGHVRRVRFGQREIVTQGMSKTIFHDLFHFFMTVSWPQLFGIFAAFFLAFDTIFGCFYYLVPGCIANLNPPGFAGAFFFSVETFATVGYGDMHPQTFYGHSIAMVEIFVGVMSLALITGLMFARFSRPRARFMFTRNMVVRPFDGRTTLMIRAANLRQNVIQDASAHLYMARDEVTQEGFHIRRVIDLPLIRSRHPMFVLGWTMMHAIDESSPLNGETADSLQESDPSFVLSMSGSDQSTGQMLTARAEYSHQDIRWHATFRDILEDAPDGTVHLDYAKFDDVESLPGAD